MLTLEAISDRLELQDLTYAYSHAIDSRDFAALKDVFIPDAHIDPSEFGGPVGSLETLLPWIHEGMAPIGGTHHLMANHQFVVDGDRATGRIMCYNPMETPGKQGDITDVTVCGLFYLDEYVRVAGSWRIASRIMKKTYIFRGLFEANSPAQ